MIVAIHQPNYFPWLGYFAKIARADMLVFLDDVQFSKGSYTNRVQIARAGAPVWLTVPVRHEFGAPIAAVEIARPDFARGHKDALRQAYRHARSFKLVWDEIEEWLSFETSRLSSLNAHLIKAVAHRLGLSARFIASSSLAVEADAADIRLAEIVERLAPGGTYLSGGGGAQYQSDDVFRSRGVSLAYSDFKPIEYPRSDEGFVPGLSVLDALFHLGFDATAKLVRPAA